MVRTNRTFRFDEARHDWGDKQWLGRHVGAQGQREGEFALDVLAQHPATARHISYKLAQYFVQDNPPPALVERLAQRYLDTRGDIASVLRTLFASPEFMAPASMGAKFKTPYRYVISAARAGDLPVANIRPLLGTLNQLGMPLYGCQTPDGYKNTEQAWLNQDALTRRLSFATALAAGRLSLAQARDVDGSGMGKRQLERNLERAMSRQPDSTQATPTPPLEAQALLATLGSAISPGTRESILGSAPNLRAALVLGSPDFMRH
ncbi:hypothetical protein BH11PSE11_BH11PSE11_20710 [soil metagenome]